MPADKDRYYMGVVDVAPSVEAALTSSAEVLTNALTLVGPPGPQGEPGPPGIQGPAGTVPVRFARKTSSQAIISSAVLVNDGELLISGLLPGEIWSFDALLVYEAHATPDIKFSFVAPAGSSGTWTILPTTVAGGGLQVSSSLSFGGAQVAAGGGLGTVIVVTARGILVVGSAGSLQLQWAQNSANANPSTLHAHSTIFATKVNP
jgi:hypothetical protein